MLRSDRGNCLSPGCWRKVVNVKKLYCYIHARETEEVKCSRLGCKNTSFSSSGLCKFHEEISMKTVKENKKIDAFFQ